MKPVNAVIPHVSPVFIDTWRIALNTSATKEKERSALANVVP